MNVLYEVVIIAKERRTYQIKATSLDAAEELALERYVCPDKTEVMDEFIHASREITKEEMVDS